MNLLLLEDHPIFRFGVRHLLMQRWPEAVITEAKAEFDGPVHAVVAGETIELQRS